MHQIGAVSKDDAVKHRTKVASHTETPLDVSKWLERNTPPYNIACPWVGDMFCVCPLPTARFYVYGCRPLQPFRRTHRHGCMAGYHCLMPTAFSFIKNKTCSAGFPDSTIWNQIFIMHNYKWCLRHFIHCNSNPFIHSYHGGLPQLLLGNDIGLNL